MDAGVYMVGSRMHGLLESLETVADNMANANTAGYKRSVTGFHAILGSVASAGRAQSGTMSPIWPDLTGPMLDLSQGPLRRTNRPLDLAVKGQAFFALDTPAGRRYTRKGRLHLSPSGELVDASGNRFVGEGGVLNVPQGPAQVTVQTNGQVVAGDEPIGRLMLVDIPRPDLLVSEGQSLYRNDGPPAETAVNAEVIQGAIEESNVHAVKEMVALIGIMRAYEASSRLVKRLDSLNSQLIKTAA